MEIVKYNRIYQIDDKVYAAINKYLNDSPIGSLEDLLDFCRIEKVDERKIDEKYKTKEEKEEEEEEKKQVKEGEKVKKENEVNEWGNDEVKEFIEKVSEKMKTMPGMLQKLENAAEYLNPTNKEMYKALLLLATVLRNVNIAATMKNEDKSYETNNYIGTLSQFDCCSFYLTEEKYKKYIYGKNVIGNYGSYYEPKPIDGTQFVMPTDIADKVDNDSLLDTKKSFEGRCHSFEDGLGYDRDYLKGKMIKDQKLTMYRIDLNGKAIQEDSSKSKKKLMSLHSKFGMNLPHGAEQGANGCFVAGGLTSGGIPEAVINRVPNTSKYVLKVYKYEFSAKEGTIERTVYSEHRYSKEFQPKEDLKKELVGKLIKGKEIQR